MKILVTGGAGFIGRHVVTELLERKHNVVILDNLDPQVHANGSAENLPAKASFIRGDVTDIVNLSEALRGVETVVHLAATVGVGQSMYEVSYYTNANITGTARLYETIIKGKLKVKKIIVASSMSVYGEGLYYCEKCKKNVRGWLRDPKNLAKGKWDLACPTCKKPLKPAPIPEAEPFNIASIYALTKRDTEEAALMLGRAHNIPTIALRFFNVYGPGQSLSNPYTGVAAIFFSRVLNNKPPVVYEDGLQSRDFIHVRDVAHAVRLAVDNGSGGEILNVGRGAPVTIKEVADLVIKTCEKEGKIKPIINNGYRAGDIRHCFADAARIKKTLDWQPYISLEDGFQELLKWSRGAKAEDHFEQAASELERYGLVRPAK